jgi:serine/threonine-protein kinase
VAIKTIHKSLVSDPEQNARQDSIAARFRNEAQAVGRIAHPGVVGIYEFGEDEHCAYIAMEFVEGRDLDQLLAQTPWLDEPSLLRLMDQLLDALAAAHAQGIWHRDIKPANLLLTAAGQLKLTDFGIARIADLNLTQVASTIGTPGYMAPEQYVGDEIDHRADIFACGVLLYRLLGGRAPFSGSPERVMYQVLHESPEPPSRVAGVQRSPAFDAVAARAMAKHPDGRYPSAQAMRQALADAAGAGAGSGAVGTVPVADDATVILPAGQAMQALTALAARAPRQAPAATLPGVSGLGSAVPTGWDPQALSRIERALASHVGPMAKLMVRDAARQCTDLPSLVTAVSQHVPEGNKRIQFLNGMADSGVRPAPSGVSGVRTVPPAPAPVSASGLVALEPLTEDFKAKAQQALSRLLGPIAKVVVRRAAEQAGGDQQRFVQLLLDGVDEKDRVALRRDLLAGH